MKNTGKKKISKQKKIFNSRLIDKKIYRGSGTPKPRTPIF